MVPAIRHSRFKELGTTPQRNLRRADSFGNVIVRKGLFSGGRDAGSIFDLFGKNFPTSIAVITDTNVIKLKPSKKLISELARKTKTDVISFTAGEKSKTMDQCSRILATLSRLGVDRDGAIILLGGGVVGDLGGFAASIYKRGIRYAQIPTTLIAQVDSSMGGKTGIDTLWGKNQVGTFYQPLGVLIDPDFLETLPPSEILNGVGEIVKYGVVASERIFRSLEQTSDFESYHKLSKLIEPCCRIKMNIVSMDERDRSIRSTLNYGHTVGHAIESASNYSIAHGLAILLGMFCEGWIAMKAGIFNEKDYERQHNLIERILADQSLAAKRMQSDRKIVEMALLDKKNVGKELRMSLPVEIGKMHNGGDGSYKLPVSRDLLEASLGFARKSMPNLFSFSK